VSFTKNFSVFHLRGKTVIVSLVVLSFVCLAPKNKGTGPFETSETIYRTTQFDISEYLNLQELVLVVIKLITFTMWTFLCIQPMQNVTISNFF